MFRRKGDRTQFTKSLDALGGYAAKNLRYPEDIKSLFNETMVAPSIVAPADLPVGSTRGQELVWETQMKSYARRTEQLLSNTITIYAVIWGQCSEPMRTKLRALDDFTARNQSNDCLWLLSEIKGVTHQFDTKRNIFLSLLDARIAYYTCSQGQGQSDADYLEVFRSNVEVLEYYKANVGESYTLIDDKNGTLSVAEHSKLARGKTIAMAFLKGADPRRYTHLWAGLANQQTHGNDQYPVDLTGAYSMLVNYHAPPTVRVFQEQVSTNVTGNHPEAPRHLPRMKKIVNTLWRMHSPPACLPQ